LVQDPGSAANRRGNRGACNAELRKGAQTKDEAGAKGNIDRICQPERPHGDGGISSPTKNRVDQKQESDGHAPAQHDPREAAQGNDLR
jgi:hypothetical protein